MSVRFLTKSESAKTTRTFRNENESSSHLEDVIFLRLPEVKAVTGLSKTTLYTLIREKSFPAPVQVGPRAVAWVRSEVKQWAANRVVASRTAVYAAVGKRVPHSVRAEPSSRKSA